MTASSRVAAALALLALVALAGCDSADRAAEPPVPSSPPASSPAALPSPATTSAPPPATRAAPPDWLGTRPLPRRTDGYGRVRPTPAELDPRLFTLPDSVPALPGDGFAAAVGKVPAEVLARSTWSPACPLEASDLAYVRLTFWGFDDQRHTGELLLNRTVAHDVVHVFRVLYRARFPIEELRVTGRSELEAAPTGDGNDTGAFVCRPSVGATSYSQHAYGLAVDLDPFQNPYTKGDLVLPELATSYVDRDRVRPGMITPGGVVVRAFDAIGWSWGGSWHSLKDYQHFSRNGR
jgi:hypothetical protein